MNKSQSGPKEFVKEDRRRSQQVLPKFLIDVVAPGSQGGRRKSYLFQLSTIPHTQ
ncbi:Hypothetical protein FKW44_011294, partial [Caligus rogercresseyi]